MSKFEKVRGVPRASGAARPGEYVQHPTHAALGRIRLPAVGVAGFSPFHLRGVVIPTSVGVHMALDAQVARHRHHRICSPDRLQVGMWRRTTGELLEVRRSALRSGASLPRNWRSICDRADLGPRGEQLSWPALTVTL